MPNPRQATGAKKIGREIFYMAEIDLEICSLVYGVGLCTAPGSPGTECYNTWKTCQAPLAYDRINKTFTFLPNTLGLPLPSVDAPAPVEVLANGNFEETEHGLELIINGDFIETFDGPQVVPPFSGSGGGNWEANNNMWDEEELYALAKATQSGNLSYITNLTYWKLYRLDNELYDYSSGTMFLRIGTGDDPPLQSADGFYSVLARHSGSDAVQCRAVGTGHGKYRNLSVAELFLTGHTLAGTLNSGNYLYYGTGADTLQIVSTGNLMGVNQLDILEIGHLYDYEINIQSLTGTIQLTGFGDVIVFSTAGIHTGRIRPTDVDAMLRRNSGSCNAVINSWSIKEVILTGHSVTGTINEANYLTYGEPDNTLQIVSAGGNIGVYQSNKVEIGLIYNYVVDIAEVIEGSVTLTLGGEEVDFLIPGIHEGEIEAVITGPVLRRTSGMLVDVKINSWSLIEKMDAVFFGEAWPCITKHPTVTPAKMEIMAGLGERGACKITMQDFEYSDLALDPYWRTRLEPAQGTFFGRFRARWPYYKGRHMRLYVGYVHEPYNKERLIERLYFLENISGPSNNNLITFEGKDVLKTISDDRVTAPAISFSRITEDLTVGETQISYEIEPGYPLLDAPAYIEIGEEVIHYAGNDGSTLTGCTRGAWGTDEPEIHDNESALQQCLYYEDVSIIDVLFDLIVNFGGIDAGLIPWEEWVLERDTWLQNNQITSLLAQPRGIDKIISALSEQHAFNIWWDETTQYIRIKAVSPETLNEIPPTFNDVEHFLANSINIKDDDSGRITQLWVYYGINDPTNSLTDPGNYKKLLVAKDDFAEGPNEFNSKKIKKIFANWIHFSQEALVKLLVDRILLKTSHYEKHVRFSLDAKDLTIWTGFNMLFHSRKVQRADGREVPLQLTITKVKETIPGTRYDFEGVGYPYDAKRYGFIMYNDAPDYGEADEETKQSGCYLSDGDNPFPDGGEPYKIA